jgi:hypothetical protein
MTNSGPIWFGSKRLHPFCRAAEPFVVTIDPKKKKSLEAPLGGAIFGEIGMVTEEEIF